MEGKTERVLRSSKKGNDGGQKQKKREKYVRKLKSKEKDRSQRDINVFQ